MKILAKLKLKFTHSLEVKVIVVLTVLHIALIFLLDKVTAFAPDENGYINIFRNLYKSDFTLVGYLGWPEGSTSVLRLLYLPAKALETVGFSDFFSVRLLAVFYSMLTLFLLSKLSSNIQILGRSSKFWIVAGFFMPSFFLWTSLGMREGFFFFGLVGTFYFMQAGASNRIKASIYLIIPCTTLLLITKIYLYSLLILAILAAVITISFVTKKLNSGSLKILTLCLIPALVFPSISDKIFISAWSVIEIKLEDPTTSTSTSTSTTTITTTNTDTRIFARGQTLHDLNTQLDNNPYIEWISRITGIDELIEMKSKNAHLPVNSKELSSNFLQLQAEPATFRYPISILKGVFNFLIVPLPFIDNGSFFLNFQSYESFAWYVYYLLLATLFIRLLRGRYQLNLQSVAATYFTLGFIFFSAMIETNDGTSVRHRSVLLIGILIMLAIFREKSSKSQSTELLKS
jgi:hypothetical protein